MCNKLLILLDSKKRVRFSSVQQNKDEKIELWRKVFSASFVGIRTVHGSLRKIYLIMCRNTTIVVTIASSPI